MTKKERIFYAVLVSCSLLLGASSCDRYRPPKVERCMLNSDALFCVDPRLEEREYDRSYSESLGYLCTSPADYGRLDSYCADIRKRLIKCERGF